MHSKGICGATSGSAPCLCVFIRGDSLIQWDKGSVNHNQKEEGRQCGRVFLREQEGQGGRGGSVYVLRPSS